ncbi:MAG: hypothetical protein ACR2IE_04720 [Candidatus Sumerlaeaceae bacterium]
MADRNPDPITGAPGSHPVGTGAGAAGGAAAGAALGAVGGPLGVVAGAAIGGVAGGLVGKGAAEAIDPTVEDAYWRENHKTASYYDRNLSYDDDYAPAYRYGYESRRTNAGKKFDDVEGDLGRGWDRAKGNSQLGWDKAKMASRDAWHRVERALPGDADGDGR